MPPETTSPTVAEAEADAAAAVPSSNGLTYDHSTASVVSDGPGSAADGNDVVLSAPLDAALPSPELTVGVTEKHDERKPGTSSSSLVTKREALMETEQKANLESEKLDAQKTSFTSSSVVGDDHEEDEPERYAAGGNMKDLGDSEAGIAAGLKRDHWWSVDGLRLAALRLVCIAASQPTYLHRIAYRQIWRPKNGPPPAPESLDTAEIIPLSYASLLSRLTYWVS
jgi:hypothetical protein